MRLFKNRANTLVKSFVKYFDEFGEDRYKSIIKTIKRVNFLEQCYNNFSILKILRNSLVVGEKIVKYDIGICCKKNF